MRYKVMAFTICSWFAALVGAMYAHYMRFIAPQEFGFWKSVECIIHVIVGGVGTFWGPIVGAAVFTFLPEWLRIAERWELVIYGLVLILTILFVPDGIWGFGGRVLAKVSKS
jgi:branched-chain amino acid transport system permease protein